MDHEVKRADKLFQILLIFEPLWYTRNMKSNRLKAYCIVETLLLAFFLMILAYNSANYYSGGKLSKFQ